MLYFPYPYPDELFCSLVARYHAHTMSPSTSNTLEELFGKRNARLSLELPSSLTSFEEKTYHLLKMTAEEVAWKTTMLPYYSSYLQEADTDRIIEIMSNGPRRNPMVVSGASTQRTRAPANLRTCPQCILEDIKHHGETYWRRSHQLRAVHFCIRHKRPLLASHHSCPNGARQVESASADMELNAYLPLLTTVESARLLRISIILTGFLERGRGDKPHVLVSDLDSSIKQSKYWTGKFVKRTALSIDMEAFFGPTVLTLLNCPMDRGSDSCWTRSTFSQKPNGGMPIRYALIKLFLQSKDTRMLPRGSGPWLCQNPMAQHYGQPTMTVSRTLRSRRRVFECSCGLVFVEKYSEGPVDCQPERYKTIRIAESDADKIRERYAAGASLNSLSKDSRLSDAYILKILEKREAKKRPDPKAARIAYANILAEKKAAAHASPGTLRKKYTWTDDSILVDIRPVVEKLKTISPPVRITCNLIWANLGKDLYHCLRRPEQFPKTIAYLDKAVETCDQGRVRAVRWHIRNWPEDRPIFRGILLRRACVRAKHPMAIAECDRLLSDLRRNLAD